MPTGSGPPPVQVRDTLGAADAAGVTELAARAAQADGVAPLSEAGLLHVRAGGGRGSLDLLLRRDGRLAGYARLDPAGEDGGRSAELVVDPVARRRGLGRVLAGELAAAAGPGGVQVWAHGDLPAAAGLAAAAGFEKSRSLWQMRRPLAGPDAPDIPVPRLPDGVTVRSFRPGRDEDAWLALNAAAFAAHPEQGGWTRADLDLREREPWFDPAGFFLAVRPAPGGSADPGPADPDGAGGRLAGFHWTKVHPATAAEPAAGEVYVVGVDPAERGTGLGRALTLAGLRYLREQGLRQVLLYVDESNVAAARLYESLGFRLWSADVMYRRAG